MPVIPAPDAASVGQPGLERPVSRNSPTSIGAAVQWWGASLTGDTFQEAIKVYYPGL